MNTDFTSKKRGFRFCGTLLSVFLASSVSAPLAAGEPGDVTVFFDDFSTFESGAFPGADENWEEVENPGRTLITDFEGTRGLTFDTPSEERTTVERAFSFSASGDEVAMRFTIRFPSSTSDNDEMNSQFVPMVRMHGDTGDIRLAMQSWGRIRVFTLDSETGELTDFNLDSDRDDGVANYIGTNRFDEFVELTLTYNRSTGLTTLSGTAETDYDFPDYTVDWDAQTGMEFNAVSIASASSTSGNRGHSENFSQIGEIGFYASGAPLITSYSDWAGAFLSEHPEEADRSDDPGGYGVSNFARYAFALDPLRPFESPLREAYWVPEDKLFGTRFQRYEGIEDVTYTVESAEEPEGPWEAHSGEELVKETFSLNDGREEVRIGVSADGFDRRFFRVRAGLPGGPEDAIFYEDFEPYSEGETPSGEWLVDIPDDTAVFVEGDAGNRYLTMTDVNQDSLAQLVRSFDTEGADTVSVTFEWYRKTGRAYNNHLGDELQWVPAFYLLQNTTDTAFYGDEIVAKIRFRSWDRGLWRLRDGSDTLTLGEVGSGDFLHDEPLLIRMTYRREGEVGIEVSKDDFETVEWSVTNDSVPDLNVNAVGIRSSNTATTGTNRLYADPVWEVRSVLVSGSND